MKQSLLILLTMLSSFISLAGNGQISGIILDEKGETLIGATVMIEGTSRGAKTDINGKFVVKNIDDNTYSLICTYISYEKKIVTGIMVANGKSEYLTISMQKLGKGLKEIVVKTAAKKESVASLLLQQKNLATISDGISAETIKRTPDRNTSDVLKRVSGVTIVDNKFAVIRGLADRYNMALLNGDILPSSESDRKAFSFDIFPSNLLENIVIVKGATPDRQGEFAGGIIDLTTKGIPTENFLNIQLGTGINTISTFKSYQDSKNSKTDWLGFDKTMRIIPSNFSEKETLNQSTLNQKIEESKKLENTWGTRESKSMMPFSNAQISGGFVKSFHKESSFGIIGAISYSRTQRANFIDRNEVNGTSLAYKFKDTTYRDNVLIGSLLNFGLKLNNRNKIYIKNSFTINSEDQTVVRAGDFIDNEYYVKGNALWYTTNQLLSNQLSGEHLISKYKIKFHWGAGRHGIHRTIPDLRRSNYTRNYDALDSNYRATVSTFANPFFMGRFFANTQETIYSGNWDLSLPYILGTLNQSIKIGSYLQTKNREYNARVLGYVRAKGNNFQQDLLLLSEAEMFSHDNIRETGFILNDVSTPSDQYTATSDLQAYYIMSDNLITKSLRVIYGARLESFNQTLITGNIKQGDLEVKKSNVNILPSMNVTYSLNTKTNFRLVASKTLSRPEFRELSPASFYDYNLSATTTGNTKLEQTTIQNYDIRYERYMGKGEMISGSAFYKYFKNPIETSVPYGLTTTQKVFSYTNAPNAKCYGLEFEFRKNLNFISNKENSIWKNIGLFGNFAYIKSEVKIETPIAGGGNKIVSRPMQGQSPYIINAGINYNHTKSSTMATIVFNRIGQRIFVVGNGEIPDMYEAPRNVLDFCISKTFYKKIEMKFTASDLFANPFSFYYNMDENYKILESKARFNADDFEVIKRKVGVNFGVSVSYKF